GTASATFGYHYYQNAPDTFVWEGPQSTTSSSFNILTGALAGYVGQVTGPVSAVIGFIGGGYAGGNNSGPPPVQHDPSRTLGGNEALMTKDGQQQASTSNQILSAGEGQHTGMALPGGAGVPMLQQQAALAEAAASPTHPANGVVGGISNFAQLVKA